MKQDMIVILDLGSTENTVVAREIRSMGVYSEIHPHDIGVEGLKKLENVKGIILNGGENRVVDGAAVDVDPALYECGVPVIAIATQDKIFAKTVSNVREVRARGAFVILLAKESARVEEDIADIQIRIPDLADQFTVFPIAAVLQLIAYYASVGKNLDVDQPRNLAKSVTVE